MPSLSGLLLAIGCSDVYLNPPSKELPEEEADTACTEDDTSAECADDCEESTFYADADQDGHGDPTRAQNACDAPDGYVTSATDCDDANNTVHPDAGELCDDIDQDCDGEARDAESSDAVPFYVDADSDGYGASDGEQQVACDAPVGYSENAGDCDDADPDRYPGAPGLCQGTDDDCDETISATESVLGSSEECAGLDCADVLARVGADGGDAVYWIDPSGAEPFEAFCDMTTDGGGWTLLAAFPTYDNSMYANDEGGVRDAFPTSTSDGFGARVSHIEASNLAFTEAIWDCTRDDGTRRSKTSDSYLIDALRLDSTTIPTQTFTYTQIEGDGALTRTTAVADVAGVENWYVRYGYSAVAAYNYYFGVNSHNNGAFGECFDAGYGGGRDWRVWVR